MSRPVLAGAALLLALTPCAAIGQPPGGLTEPEANLLKDKVILTGDSYLGADLPDFLSPRNLKSYESPTGFLGLGDLFKRDTDDDGLSDKEEASLGTSPTNADTDGDALLDGWEVYGVNGLNLRAMGASPTHKDIFVQMDFMVRDSAGNGLGPNPAVIAGIIDVFANANVDNPDGKPGIAIHLLTGSEVAYDADLSPLEPQVLAIKNQTFDPARAPVFHYMIWADAYEGGSSSGNSMRIPNSDFVVTLGRWNGGQGGTDEEKIGTFVHELGHNLGLRHGNFDNANYKPNHLSVMNYAFQTEGVYLQNRRQFTYQRFDLPGLDEQSLNEQIGIGSGPELQNGRTTWFNAGPNYFVEGPTGGAIDWNWNGTAAENPVATDLNGNGGRTTLAASQKEWSRLTYDGGAIGRDDPLKGLNALPFQLGPPIPLQELDEDLRDRLRNRLKAPG